MLCHIDGWLFCARAARRARRMRTCTVSTGTVKRKLTGGVTTARPYSLLGGCEPWCSEPCSETKGDDWQGMQCLRSDRFWLSSGAPGLSHSSAGARTIR